MYSLVGHTHVRVYSIDWIYSETDGRTDDLP